MIIVDRIKRIKALRKTIEDLAQIQDFSKEILIRHRQELIFLKGCKSSINLKIFK